MHDHILESCGRKPGQRRVESDGSGPLIAGSPSAPHGAITDDSGLWDSQCRCPGTQQRAGHTFDLLPPEPCDGFFPGQIIRTSQEQAITSHPGPGPGAMMMFYRMPPAPEPGRSPSSRRSCSRLTLLRRARCLSIHARCSRTNCAICLAGTPRGAETATSPWGGSTFNRILRICFQLIITWRSSTSTESLSATGEYCHHSSTAAAQRLRLPVVRVARDCAHSGLRTASR